MIETMTADNNVDFEMMINGKHCHEQEDAIDEASIFVDKNLSYNSKTTDQLIQPVKLPGVDQKSDQ